VLRVNRPYPVSEDFVVLVVADLLGARVRPDGAAGVEVGVVLATDAIVGNLQGEKTIRVNQ
jgi:hypothetical protein